MFSEFIVDKGVARIADACGVAESTVRKWKERNRIPRERWDAIMDRWPSLKYSHMKALEAASRRQAA